MSFWDGMKDWMLAVGNPDEWERQRAQRNVARSSAAHNTPRPHALQQERQRREQLLGHIVTRALTKASSVQKGRDLQYEDEGCKVKVKSGYDWDHNAVVTDVIIIDRSDPTQHYHTVIDELSGNVLYEGWRDNRR